MGLDLGLAGPYGVYSSSPKAKGSLQVFGAGERLPEETQSRLTLKAQVEKG